MLALLGFITIVTLLAAILTKRMSPLVALIAIPIIAALIGGFGLETSKFIVSAIHRHDHIAEAVDRFAVGADQAGFEHRGQAVAT